MTACRGDPLTLLREAHERLGQVLQLAPRHAAGDVDADQWVAACAALAQAFVSMRDAWGGSAPSQAAAPEAARLLEDIGNRLQLLQELQARLSGSTRTALAQLLPQDALQAYTQLGRSRRGGYT
jgi:hypothetical protein